MRCRTRTPRPGSDDAGFSLVESLIATVLMLTVTGVVFSFVNPNTTMRQ